MIINLCLISNKRLKISINYLLFITLLSLSFLTVAVTMNKEERKVILIGIDGMDYQTLQRLATPNFDRLYTSELFTGGELNTETEQQTYSGPSWATILTGVWANQHQIIKNDKNLKSATPSLFDRINQVYPQAKLISVIRWDTIYDNLYSDISFAQHKIVIKEHDFKAVEKFIELLKNKPDFAFLHLDDVDHAGHDFGFSKEYDQSIIDADLMLGKIIDVIENNKQVNEKYLIIVTTDHGRNNSGKEHGGQSNSEKITFYATNNDFYHRKKTLQITGAIPQTYIANSILDYLHVTPLK